MAAMNNELYTLFQELSPDTQQTLDFVFKDSPKMLLLINFLRVNSANFSTQKAVNYIYTKESKDTDFNVLVNRYHKLRQSLIEWLYHFFKKTANFHSKEEQELEFIRFLVSKNQFGTAIELALPLEEQYWKNNLFELLPNLLQLIIFCRNSLGQNKADNRAYQERLMKAIELEYRLQQLQCLYQESYAINTEAEYQDVLNRIRRCTANEKQQLRFALLYHYTAFMRGNFVPELRKNSSAALIRHLNQLEKIHQENPDMPFVFLSLPRAKAVNAQLLGLKSIFYFLRSSYKEAAQALKDLELLKKKHPDIEFPESEAMLRNSIIIFIGNRQFDLAWAKAAELERFIEKNEESKGHRAILLYEITHIVFFQFPDIEPTLIKKYYKEVLSCEADAEGQKLLRLAKLWFDILLFNPLVEEDLVLLQSYYRSTGNHIDIGLLYELAFCIRTKNKEGLKALIKKTKTLLKQKCDNVQELLLKQIGLIGTHYLAV